MKLIKILMALLVFVVIGGGIYLGAVDISIPQEDVTKEVSMAPAQPTGSNQLISQPINTSPQQN